ncbi:MAG: hypothetical protein ABSH22_08800 [Tepidisphaeraceae bacterium]|jgi:hypothetical protein
MVNQYVRFVAETFSLTLETLAFITSQPPAEADGTKAVSAPPDAMLARLFLSGGDATALEIVAGRQFGRLLAANLMGLAVDDDETELRCTDALKELINVVGGALLRLAAEPDAQMPQMGVPLIEPFESAIDWETFVACPDVSVLDAEGNTIALRMRGAA